MSENIRSLLVFPIFSRCWTLLQVDLREKIVTFFDPTGRRSGLNPILASLYAYLRSELGFHRGVAIETTCWSSFRYVSSPNTEVCDRVDSGLLVCREAYVRATGKTEPMIERFREKLVKTLQSELEGVSG